jgi:ParB family chromosome partitioning protein
VTAVTLEPRRVMDLALEHVHPDPQNLRDDLELDEGFVDSIRVSGVVEPLIVRVHPELGLGEYMIVAGHRRRAGSELAGLSHVPCVLRGEGVLDDAQVLELMLGREFAAGVDLPVA